MNGPQAHYRRGRGLLEMGRYSEAATHFHAAMFAEKKLGVVRPQMRYRSFYCLSRALSGSPKLDEVRMCEQAAAADAFDPVLLLNLGRVYLRAGKTTRALLTFQRGLRLDPENRELRTVLARNDRRARPVLSGLRRDHPVNRSLGRLRAQLFRKRN